MSEEQPKIIGSRDMDIVIHCHEETRIFRRVKAIPRTYSVRFDGMDEESFEEDAANLTHQFMIIHPKIFSKALKVFVEDSEFPDNWDKETLNEMIKATERFRYSLKEFLDIIEEEEIEKEGGETENDKLHR